MSPSRLPGTARAALRESGPAPTQSRRLPRLGRTRPTTDQPSSAKLRTRRTQVRSGSVYADLRLRSGQLAVCTFRNVRIGSPAIAIDKVGPASATAGDTLRYQLVVSNPGDLPFPAASVEVVDPNCDDPPALVGKADPRRRRHAANSRPGRCLDVLVLEEDRRAGGLQAVRRHEYRRRHGRGGRKHREGRQSYRYRSHVPPQAAGATRATQPYAGADSAAAYASVARCATGAVAAGCRRCSGRRCRLPSDPLPVHSRPGSSNQPRGHTDLSRPRARERPTSEGADRAGAAAATDSARHAPAREVQAWRASDLPARDGQSGRPPPGHDSDLQRGARRPTAVHRLATGSAKLG